MANLSCLHKDTRLVENLKQVLRIKAAEVISNDKVFTLSGAYRFLVENNVEIDLESVGNIYEDIFDLNDANFSSQSDVDDLVGRSFKGSLDNMVKMQGTTTEEKTGILSPGKAVAKKLTGIFWNANVTNVKTQTMMKKFQDALEDAARKVANNSALPQKAKSKKDYEDILYAAFDLDKHGYRTLHGGLNSVGEVWKEFRKEIEKYRNEYAASGASQANIASFDLYTDAIVNKSYDLFLSTSEAKQVLTGILTDKKLQGGGFGREVTVNGKTEVRLDWKKLVGAGGSIANMRKNVEMALSNNGYNQQQIDRVHSALEDEYIRLRTNVIDRAASELSNRNKQRDSKGKTAARRAAELHSYGLFDATPVTYDKIVNNLFGVSDIDQNTFDRLKVLAGALRDIYDTATLYGRRATDAEVRTAIDTVGEKIKLELNRHTSSKSGFLRAVRFVQGLIYNAQRMILHSLRNAYIQNPVSGFSAALNTSLAFNYASTKELQGQQRSVMLAIFKDIVASGGIGYGDISSQFLNKSALDARIESLSDSKLYQTLLSVWYGRMALDATDATVKISMTEKMFAAALIKVLRNPTNPNGFATDEEAIRYVSEHLTGQTFEDAKAKAKNITNTVNQNAGKKILPDNESAIVRLANELVKGALITGGKITEDQLLAAYRSSYKAAGLSLGHEPNNPVSRQMNNLSVYYEQEIERSIKEGNYRRAAAYTAMQTINRAFINPFLGGATNWIVLKLEKNGLGLITGMLSDAFSKSRQVDMASETDVRRLQDRLLHELSVKQKYMRGLIGGLTSFASFAFMSTICDDDTGKGCYGAWREENQWAAKYTDEAVSTWYLTMLMAKMGSKEFMKFLGQLFGLQEARASYDASAKLVRASGKFVDGDTDEALGLVGEAVGSKSNIPLLPWRPFKDGVELVKGYKDTEPFQYDYSKSYGFWEGATKGGFLEYIGANVKGNESDFSDWSESGMKAAK